MKLALVGSLAHTLQARELYKSAYHLALAQHCIDDDRYANFFRAVHKQGEFVILDNGAAELQMSLGFDKVLKVFEYINADEVVLPDVLDDMERTLNLTSSWHLTVPFKNRAMVPQGQNWDEWTTCALEMARLGCATFGIAKRYERLEGGRAHAISILYENGLLDDHHVHLLGAYANPLVEAEACVKWARGMDTAAPFAYAQQKVGMDIGAHVPYEWDDPFDKNLLALNIDAMLRACECT